MLTLLEMLPCMNEQITGMYIDLCFELCKSQAGTIRAGSISCLSQLLTENNFSDILKAVLMLQHDTNLYVIVKNSQACATLAQLLAQKPLTDETNQAGKKELYNVILKYSKSGKDKTTANAIRALGYLPS